MTPLSAVVAASKWMHEKVTSKSYKPAHGGRSGNIYASQLEDKILSSALIVELLHNRKFEKTRIPSVSSIEEASVFFGINFHKSPGGSKDCGCKTL